MERLFGRESLSTKKSLHRIYKVKVATPSKTRMAIFCTSTNNEARGIADLMRQLDFVEHNHVQKKFPLCYVANAKRETIYESKNPIFDPYKPFCVNCVAFINAFRLVEGFEAIPDPEDFRFKKMFYF
jgi:hypothetical protein